MEVEFIQLWEHPAHAAVSSTHQDTKRHKLLEEAEAEREREGGLAFQKEEDDEREEEEKEGEKEKGEEGGDDLP